MDVRSFKEERRGVQGIMCRLRKLARAAAPSMGVITAAFLFATAAAGTAEADDKVDTSGTRSMSLESISVTANKMEENISKVPQSISVINEYDIEDKEIKNVEGIQSSKRLLRQGRCPESG